MTDQQLFLSLSVAHLQAFAALGAAGAAAWLLRRRPAGSRHAVRAAGFLLALLVPVVALLMPDGPFSVRLPLLSPDASAAEAPAALPRRGDLVLQTTPASNLMTVEPPAAVAAIAPAAASPALASSNTPAPTLPPIPPPLRWSTVLLWAWLGGTLLLLSRIAIQHLVAMRRGSRAVPVEDDFALALLEEVRAEICPDARINLLIGAHASIPYMRGLRTIDVVVPAECADWTPERWELVLRHELSHVRRSDFFWHQLAAIACALHWPNPLVWRAARCLRADSERACDDLVLSSGLKASEYASLLVDFARQAPPLQAAALAIARPNDLVARVESILDPATPRLAKGASPMKRTLVLSSLLLASFLLIDVNVVARDRAESAAEVAMKRDPDPAGEAWFSVAWEAHQKKDYAFSSLGFTKAALAGHAPALSHYNAACASAMLGGREDAFKHLDLAIEAGFVDVGQIDGDSDFDSLRGDERFGAALERVKMNRAERRKSWGQWLASWMDEKPVPSLEAIDAKEAAKRNGSRESWQEFTKEAEKVAGKLDSGEVSFQLGYAYLMLGDGAKALPHFEAALAEDHMPEESEYNIACAHALAGDAEAAMDVLTKIADDEKLWRHDIARDYDLRSLRGRKDFQNLVHRQKDDHGHSAFSTGSLRNAIATVSSNAGKWASGGSKTEYDKFYQAYDLHMEGEFEESIPMFRECYEAGINPDKSSYNIACGYARLGKEQEAFDWLRIAIGEGVLDGFDVAADSDMKGLLDDPRFAEIMHLVEKRQAIIG